MRERLRPSEVAYLLDDLRRIVRVLRRSSRAAERSLGVSGAQLFALMGIAETPGISLSELALRTRTHQSTVSVVVKRLIAAKLVSRVPSKADGRVIELVITTKGLELLEKAPFAAQERLIAGIEQLPLSHGRELATSLRRLVTAMKLEEEPAVMFFEDEAAPPSRGATNKTSTNRESARRESVRKPASRKSHRERSRRA